MEIERTKPEPTAEHQRKKQVDELIRAKSGGRGEDTGMDNLSMSMQKIQSLQKPNNGAPDEVFVKSILLEHHLHDAQAHLRSFRDKNNTFAMWTSGPKESSNPRMLPRP